MESAKTTSSDPTAKAMQVKVYLCMSFANNKLGYVLCNDGATGMLVVPETTYYIRQGISFRTTLAQMHTFLTYGVLLPASSFVSWGERFGRIVYYNIIDRPFTPLGPITNTSIVQGVNVNDKLTGLVGGCKVIKEEEVDASTEMSAETKTELQAFNASAQRNRQLEPKLRKILGLA